MSDHQKNFEDRIAKLENLILRQEEVLEQRFAQRFALMEETFTLMEQMVERVKEKAMSPMMQFMHEIVPERKKSAVKRVTLTGNRTKNVLKPKE